MSNVVASSATGEEISAVIDKIDSAVDGCPYNHVIIAAIAMAITLQKPDIEEDELQELVMKVSKYVVLLLDGGVDTVMN